ncbi:MAG: hypothetical protein OXG44_06400 [Gammaproteobacteria bacterium]|nr:hypothetical protein [Gammaproteobacteria bacterium]
MLKLRPFQRRAVKAFESGRYDVVTLCLPRSQGKSSLAAELCFRALTPGDSLHREGTESHLVAASIGQSRRTCFKLLRRMVESSKSAGDYKISENNLHCHIRHVPTNTRVSVVAATAKATLGLVGCPFVVLDEPGSYDLEGGASLWDALTTALGKPESDLRLFVIGHLAPRATGPGHWLWDLVTEGTNGRTWVYAIQGRPEKWDQAAEIRRCSPLSWSFPKSRAKLLEQRDRARSDPRLRAAFLSYRLNVPSADESAALLTVADWLTVCGRPVAPRDGAPQVGIDLGSGRAWSAAVAHWPNGRVECLAVAPGVPSIRDQERRDHVTPGTYQRLVDLGLLVVADGLRVPPPALLVSRIRQWAPASVVCDTHRLNELLDAAKGLKVRSRPIRWAEQSQDVRALRRFALDGPCSVEPVCRPLLQASLQVARVNNDDAGNVRMVKRGTNNTARDDVAAAWVLAAGAVHRVGTKRRTHVAVNPKAA